MEKLKLEPGCYYHIYNRGNNGENIFFEDDNYEFFLKRYDQYISPVCDTIAWVLLRNHFHLLVYVKTAEEIHKNQLTYQTVETPTRLDVHLQFGHFFNSYAKAINKRFNRTGSLFEKNFERKMVTNISYFRKLIYYIHHNPVKHGFVDRLEEYPWSSYGSIITHKPTKLNRKFVLDIFNNKEEFELFHHQNQKLNDIDDLIIE